MNIKGNQEIDVPQFPPTHLILRPFIVVLARAGSLRNTEFKKGGGATQVTQITLIAN